MAKKKIKPSKKGDILNSGPATYRQATPQEMTKHRETVKRDKKEKTHKYSSSNKRDKPKENKPIAPNKPKENKPIALNKPKEKTGISAYREKDTIGGKIVKAATSLKTTAVLGAALATGGAALAATSGATAAAGATTITRTATSLNRIRNTSLVTQRAFVGKSAQTGINKIFHLARPVAAKFATNQKSIGLTQKLWLGLGIGVSAAFLAKDVYGTYPYAEFIGKEEALQTVGIPIFLAIEAGDLEGAETLIAEQEEIIASDLGKVPYKNVRNAIANYQEAQKEAIAEFERLIAQKRREIEFEGTSTGEDIEAAQKKKDVKKAEELEFESEFFRLIREGKQQEADDLQAEFIKKLKGGENE